MLKMRHSSWGVLSSPSAASPSAAAAAASTCTTRAGALLHAAPAGVRRRRASCAGPRAAAPRQRVQRRRAQRELPVDAPAAVRAASVSGAPSYHTEAVSPPAFCVASVLPVDNTGCGDCVCVCVCVCVCGLASTRLRICAWLRFISPDPEASGLRLGGAYGCGGAYAGRETNDERVEFVRVYESRRMHWGSEPMLDGLRLADCYRHYNPYRRSQRHSRRPRHRAAGGGRCLSCIRISRVTLCCCCSSRGRPSSHAYGR